MSLPTLMFEHINELIDIGVKDAIKAFEKEIYYSEDNIHRISDVLDKPID